MVLLLAVVSAGVYLGPRGFVERRELDEKRSALRVENSRITREIRSLEREVTLLRTDMTTIARAAKRKLGMAGADETVYVFESAPSQSGPSDSVYGLADHHKVP